MKSSRVKLSDNKQPFLSSLLYPFGRVRRRYFCYYLLIYVVFNVLISLLSGLLMSMVQSIGMLIAIIFYVALLGVWICQTVRRYHDFGFSGVLPGIIFVVTMAYTIMLSLPGAPLVQMMGAETTEVVRIVIWVLFLILMVFVPALVPGTKGFNHYGSNPRYDYKEQLAEYKAQQLAEAKA